MVLIVFTIELILLNRSVDDGDSEPALSGSAPDNADGNGDTETADASPPGTANNGGPGTSAEAPPTPTGTMHVRLMPNDMDLVFYVDANLFEHTLTEQEDIIDVFSLRGDGTATLDIRFVFMPQGINSYADNFLEVDFGAQVSASQGEESIRRSPLRGVFASGTMNDTTYEAWIYRFADPELENLGLAFIINFQNETQRNALYAVLDSLEIENQ